MKIHLIKNLAKVVSLGERSPWDIISVLLTFSVLKKLLQRIKKVKLKLKKSEIRRSLLFDKENNLSKITLFKNHCEDTCMGLTIF